MAINSRSKGCKNERDAAKLVSKWTGYKFERTPSSGGLQWKGSFAKGDIVITVDSHYHPFCWEIKAHKEIDFSHLLNPKIKNIKIIEFWTQCTRDAEKCKKIPVLMMRYNNMPKDFFFLAIPSAFWIHAKKSNPQLKKIHTITDSHHKITMMGSTSFFEQLYKPLRKTALTYLKPTKNG